MLASFLSVTIISRVETLIKKKEQKRTSLIRMQRFYHLDINQEMVLPVKMIKRLVNKQDMRSHHKLTSNRDTSSFTAPETLHVTVTTTNQFV